MITELLSTGFALICALACGFAAWQTFHDSRQAHDDAMALRPALARIATLEAELMSLRAQHLKLRGTFYAAQGAGRPPSRTRDFDDQDELEKSIRRRLVEIGDVSELDPELAAELALQRAPAAGPG